MRDRDGWTESDRHTMTKRSRRRHVAECKKREKQLAKMEIVGQAQAEQVIRTETHDTNQRKTERDNDTERESRAGDSCCWIYACRMVIDWPRREEGDVEEKGKGGWSVCAWVSV